MHLVRIGVEYITLGQFLKRQNYIASGGEAKVFLQQQFILVNGEEEHRRGRKLRVGDVVKVRGDTYLIESQASHED